MTSLDPVRILKPLAQHDKGENARLSNFVGAVAVGDLMKSTLGPKGMDKLLVRADGQNRMTVNVSNDGATILRSIGFENPAAKILVNMAKAQDELVGDGTTSVVILAAELLREAEELIARKIHPQTIISGFRIGGKIALDTLEAIATGGAENEEMFGQKLMNIARTSLCSKILNIHKEKFSRMAVDAVLRLKGSSDLKCISIIKIPGGSLEDSFLDDGFILTKCAGKFQQKRIENAKILIANASLDMDKPKCFGSRVRVDSITKLADLELAEKSNMKDKIDNIKKFGCNVFVNRQQIYDYPEQLFSDSGMMSVELADFDGVERLALATGGEIVSTFDDVERTVLGECDYVEEIMIGERSVLKFGGVKCGNACTVVLRGSTQQLVDEAERSLHDALCVLSGAVSDRRTVYGGGACEVAVASALAAETLPGREAAALEAYSRALLKLPRAVADNAGLDSDSALAELRAAHADGLTTFGIDLETGGVACMESRGVLEPLAVKRQVIMSAGEAAELILRVDHILQAEPRKRQVDHRMC